MLPFQRIAIFSPELTFHRPWETMSPAEAAGAVRSWADISLTKGADAWYLRWRDEAGMAMLMEALASYDTVKLLPRILSHLGSAKDGVHHSSKELWDDPGGEGLVRGCSCHNIADLDQADMEGMDYAFYSPIFPTETHPGAMPQGLEGLAQACHVSAIPIFALGGVISANEQACIDAGAHGIAGIRMFI